jgi:hypothetical protein
VTCIPTISEKQRRSACRYSRQKLSGIGYSCIWIIQLALMLKSNDVNRSNFLLFKIEVEALGLCTRMIFIQFIQQRKFTFWSRVHMLLPPEKHFKYRKILIKSLRVNLCILRADAKFHRKTDFYCVQCKKMNECLVKYSFLAHFLCTWHAKLVFLRPLCEHMERQQRGGHVRVFLRPLYLKPGCLSKLPTSEPRAQIGAADP